jgi:predicted P-loop ATPase
LKEDVEDANKQDKMTLETLNEIARKAGYKTLDEYIADAEKQLTPDERKEMEKMKTDMEGLDEDMAISHKVFRGLIAVGLLTQGLRKCLMF